MSRWRSRSKGKVESERPTLQPLPLEPFRYYRFGVRTVHLDGCVEVEAVYYSTPPGWIGQRVEVQWTDLHVPVVDPKTGQLLREHVRAPRGHHRIADPDRPTRTPRQRGSYGTSTSVCGGASRRAATSLEAPQGACQARHHPVPQAACGARDLRPLLRDHAARYRFIEGA